MPQPVEAAEWRARPEFVYCPDCGPNARIETKPTLIGESWVCLYCGSHGTLYAPGLTPPFSLPVPLMKDPIE